MENIKITTIDDQTLSILIPTIIRRRKGYATRILSERVEEYHDIENPQNYNERLAKAVVSAFKWQKMLQEKLVSSFNEIANIENTDSAYVAKVFKLTYLAPDIIEAILKGTQPQDLKLRDFTAKAIPDLWEEQREVFGF